MDGFNEEIWAGANGFTYDVLDGTTRIGMLFSAVDAEFHGKPANKETWCWENGQTPWSNSFDLIQTAPTSPFPDENQTSYDQLTFTAALVNHDLSSSSLKVWRIAHFIPGTGRQGVGYLTRHNASGVLDWYAKPKPTDGIFKLASGEKLKFRKIDNSGLTAANACKAN